MKKSDLSRLSREAGTRVSLGPTPREFPNDETYAQHVASIISETFAGYGGEAGDYDQGLLDSLEAIQRHRSRWLKTANYDQVEAMVKDIVALIGTKQTGGGEAAISDAELAEAQRLYEQLLQDGVPIHRCSSQTLAEFCEPCVVSDGERLKKLEPMLALWPKLIELAKKGLQHVETK
jgi:hypothetical protein